MDDRTLERGEIDGAIQPALPQGTSAPFDPLPRPLTLRDLVSVFARQKLLISFILLLSIVGGFIAIVSTEPTYQSETSILIEGRTQNSGPVLGDPVMAVTLPANDRDIQTQIEVLQSTKLILDTYRTIGISFPQGPLSRETLEQILPHVTVEQAGTTNVIRISVDSSNANTAVQLAQTIPTVYLDYVSLNRQAEVDNALTFLNQRLKEERAGLTVAETQLQAFKQSRALMPLEGEAEVRSRQVTSAESSLAAAAATVASVRERLTALQKSRAALPETLLTPTESANTTELQGQKDQIASLKARRSALLERLQPSHPEIQSLDAEIASREEHLRTTPRVIDASSTSRHPSIIWFDERIAEAKASLQSALAEQSKVQAWAKQTQTALRQYHTIALNQNDLVRSIEEKESSIEALIKAIEDLRVRRNSVRDPVTILTPATAASRIRPKTAQYIGLAFLIGILLALSLALVKDGLEDTVLSEDDLTTLTRLPILASFPSTIGTKRRHRLRREQEVRNSYNILSLSLAGPLDVHPLKSLLFTNGTERQTLTTLATEFSILTAQTGLKVALVITDDLRSMLPAGFRNQSSGDTTLNSRSTTDTLQTTILHESKKYSIISLSPAPFATSSIYSSCQKLIERWQASHDVVILCSSDAAASATTRALASLTEATIICSIVGITKRRTVSQAVAQLAASGATIRGHVLYFGKAHFTQAHTLPGVDTDSSNA